MSGSGGIRGGRHEEVRGGLQEVALRRGWLRGFLIVAVVLTLGGIGFLMGQTLVDQRRAQEKVVREVLDPSVSQSIRQFHRVKVEEGRTVWDLRAEKADMMAAGQVLVEVPEIAFYSDEGQSVRLSGMRGEVQLQGQDVERIDLNGGIEVELGDYRLETPEAVWQRASNSVVASSGVDLRGGPLVVTGDVMTVNLGSRRILVTGRVKTVISKFSPEYIEAIEPLADVRDAELDLPEVERLESGLADADEDADHDAGEDSRGL